MRILWLCILTLVIGAIAVVVFDSGEEPGIDLAAAPSESEPPAPAPTPPATEAPTTTPEPPLVTTPPATVQTVAPVENEFERIVWKPMGRILAGGPIDVSKGVYAGTPPASHPDADSTAAWGEYFATAVCAYCHGPNLEGQMVENGPEPILAPDLRASGQWPAEMFHEVMATGVTPDGREMDPEVMPWTMTARMTETERESLRLYLASLGPATPTDA